MQRETTHVVAEQPLGHHRPSIDGTIAFVITMVVVYALGQVPF